MLAGWVRTGWRGGIGVGSSHASKPAFSLLEEGALLAAFALPPHGFAKKRPETQVSVPVHLQCISSSMAQIRHRTSPLPLASLI
jgi:hypothetical protein